MKTNASWIFLARDYADEWESLVNLIAKYQAECLIHNYNKGFDSWLETQKAIMLHMPKKILNIIKGNEDVILASMMNNISIAKEVINTSIQEQASFVGKKPLIKVGAVESALIKSQKGNLKEGYALLIKVANRAYSKIIKDIETAIIYSFSMKEKTKDLFNAITLYGANLSNAMKVNYKDGRTASFRTYIEMKTRTTINDIANDLLEESSKQLGLVFHICNHLIDSAPDHAHHQGKVYVIDNWQEVLKDDAEMLEKAKEYIAKNDTKTLKEIKGTPVWLTTRPNCRHFFSAITYEQALNVNDTLKHLSLKKGNYLESNYEALKKQRYNERAIRKYKEKLSSKKAMLPKCDVDDKAKLKKEISSLAMRVKMYQQRQARLIADNPFLTRQYQRENAKKLAFDLGAEYQKNKK